MELAKFFDNHNSPHGEALQECKTSTDRRGKIFYLKVYTFLMKRTDNTVARTIEKSEGGARGSFSLTDVLLMPLARNTKTGEKNSYGIHFSARKRIFRALERAGYDFLELIPDLPKFFDELSPDEVGEDVYWILHDALEASKPEKAISTVEHEKTCPCDTCWQKWWASRPTRNVPK